MTQQGQPQGDGRRPSAQTIVIAVFAALVLVGLGVFFARAGGQPRLSGIERADPRSPTLVAAGRQLYVSRCAGCHGAGAQGAAGWQSRSPGGVQPAPPLDGGGPAPQRTDARLFAVIKQGGQPFAAPETVSAMPGFGANLNDAEIWALVSYIKSTWPPELQTAQPAR
jgi:mono/diheme cytochrome c family protein